MPHAPDFNGLANLITSVATLAFVLFNAFAALHNSKQTGEVKALVNGNQSTMQRQIVSMQATIDDLRGITGAVQVIQAVRDAQTPPTGPKS